MTEGPDRVRTVREHLRRAAALLNEGQVAAALAEADAALALDAQSLPAQALRERILQAQSGRGPENPELRAAADSLPHPRSFVPHGVNAASWRGFEQRIQERRFRALLDTMNTSIAAGDAAGARVALEEARELRPDDPELRVFEARVAAVPLALPTSTATAHIWMRGLGALAMLLIGVSLLIGIEWLQPSERIHDVPIVLPEAPVATPARDLRMADTDADVDTAGDHEEVAVPAIVTPPEPALRPRGTAGTGEARPSLRRDTVRQVAARDAQRELPRPESGSVSARAALVAATPAPRGEVPDDYVARLPVAPIDMPARGIVTAPPERPSIDARLAAAEPAPATDASPALLVPEQSRVEAVLQRYARAYANLDASAARAIWPSVDERALARAFDNLASQNVSFDACDISIRGEVANASCRGAASYVGKVGSRERRTEPLSWRFELRREGDAWKIENAEARRRPDASDR